MLYDAVASKLLGYLRLRGAGDPEGLLGDTFVQLARNLDTFEGDEAGFRSWAFTIAHHRLIDERRRHARRPTPVTLDQAPVDSWAATTDVESEAIEAADLGTVDRLLAHLSEDQRTVVVLRILGGLTASETARTMGKSEGSVRVLLHRALRILRDRLHSRGVTR